MEEFDFQDIFANYRVRTGPNSFGFQLAPESNIPGPLEPQMRWDPDRGVWQVVMDQSYTDVSPPCMNLAPRRRRQDWSPKRK